MPRRASGGRRPLESYRDDPRILLSSLSTIGRIGGGAASAGERRVKPMVVSPSSFSPTSAFRVLRRPAAPMSTSIVPDRLFALRSSPISAAAERSRPKTTPGECAGSPLITSLLPPTPTPEEAAWCCGGPSGPSCPSGPSWERDGLGARTRGEGKGLLPLAVTSVSSS